MKRKAIFDTIRDILKRGLTQSEVDRIDDVLDSAIRPDAPTEPEKNETPGTIGPQGVQLIKRFESCARLRPDGLYEAYPDPGTGGAPWTIGWGSTGPGIAPGTVWTKEQCDERFEKDLLRYAGEVVRALGSSINGTSQAQFDALVSFHYNTGAIGRATLTRLHKAGQYEAAAKEFDLWKYAGGQVLKGLVRRRNEEAKLYRSRS